MVSGASPARLVFVGFTETIEQGPRASYLALLQHCVRVNRAVRKGSVHDPALRPAQRRGQLGRGRAYPDLTLAGVRLATLSCWGHVGERTGSDRSRASAISAKCYQITLTSCCGQPRRSLA